MDCKNCKSNLKNNDGYCSGCGARVIEERITFQFIFKEILDKVLSVDNKLLKTFWHLFSKPHKVIDNYIVGVRKRYFNPFSYLLVSITLAGISFYFLRDIALQAVESTTLSNATGNPFENRDFQQDFISFIFDYQAFLTALIIPMYGLISWIVFLNKKKYNYFEHIVIYLYATAQISILNFIIATPLYFVDHEAANIASISISVLSFVYNAYVLIRLFKLNFIQFIIKLFYFMFISTIIYIVWSVIAFLGMLYFLGPGYFKQFNPVHKKDSIQKVQPIDSIQLNKKNNSLEEAKTISYYEASSKLNCLS